MESMAVKIVKEKRKQNVICENTKFGGIASSAISMKLGKYIMKKANCNPSISVLGKEQISNQTWKSGNCKISTRRLINC